MRAVVISVINISSILLVIMIHNTVNEDSAHRMQLDSALAVAMNQTMEEIMEQGHYGMNDRNEMVAAFLQSMLQKVDQSVSLTVVIHKLDEEKGMMDVEAVGEYMISGHKRKQISIRRKIILAGT